MILVLVAFVMAIASPSPGRAAWTVKAGGYTEDQALQAQKFLPSSITINEGDSVMWILGGNSHTIFFPAGEKPPDVIVPGKTKGDLIFNPQIYFPTGSRYNGSGSFSAGVLEDGVRTRYTVTFTKAGAYRYLCLFHPGMGGEVMVRPAGSVYPKTQAQFNRIGEQEAQASFAAARAQTNKALATAAKTADNTTYTMSLVGSAQEKFTILRFLPNVLKIKAGDTVIWKMEDPTEGHTVTFTSGRKPPRIEISRPQNQGQPIIAANPVALAPAGGAIYEGQGYFSSGIMEIQTPQGVRSYSLTFTTPGRYDYTCLAHGPVGMKGTIIVTK